MWNRLRTIEHLAASSVFLFGLFTTVLNYLHTTPLPPSWSGAAFAIGGIIRGLDYAHDKWKAKLDG